MDHIRTAHPVLTPKRGQPTKSPGNSEPVSRRPAPRVRDSFCECGHHLGYHGRNRRECAVFACVCNSYVRPRLLGCIECRHIAALHLRRGRWGACASPGCVCRQWVSPPRPCCRDCGHPFSLHQGGDRDCRALGCQCAVMVVSPPARRDRQDDALPSEGVVLTIVIALRGSVR